MEGTKVMMSLYEAKTAKKVYVYRNGAINSQPKCMVVNERQVRDFSTFLNRVTSGLKAPVAVRNIYTPSGGHKVRTLGDLRSGHYYVAGGSEHFKKVKYGNSPQRLMSRRPPKNELFIPMRTQKAVVASARYRKPVEKPFVIHVFRNGDERYRGARVLLTRRVMMSWERVLELVAEKANLFTPAKRLCTLDGRTVHAVSELQDGGKYVAIEGTKGFQRVSYCATEEKRVLRHTLPKITVRTRRSIKQSQPSDSEAQEESGLSDSNKTPFLTASLRNRALKRRQSRPMAGRKNKEAREKAVMDHRADSIFGGSPTRQLPSPLPHKPSHTNLLLQHTPVLPKDNETSTSPHKSPSPLSPPPPKSDSDSDKVEESAQPGKLETKAEDDGSSGATASKPASDEVVDEVIDEDLMSSKGSDTAKQTGVFHAHTKPQQQQQQQQHSDEYVEDSQGESVFKAKAEHREVEGAEAVAESGDTEVERPVDMEEAQEVAEEVEEEKEDKEKAKQVSQDVELKSQPLQTSIDLSLNRTTQVEEASSLPPNEDLTTTPREASSPTKARTASITSHNSKPVIESRPVSEPIMEEIQPSRTHSVLSKRSGSVKDGEGEAGSKVKEDEKEEQETVEAQEEVAEEIEEGVDNGDVPDQALSQGEQPVTTSTHDERSPQVQHTGESELANPDEEIIEEVKEEDNTLAGDEQDTGSQHHDEVSTAPQPDDSNEPDNTVFVVEDPSEQS